MRITFLGAAREVTGSAYLVETRDVRLLVDCGLFQGGKIEREKNWHALDFDVKSLDFVILTHAHLDHCGLLPVLVRRGYRGPVYATAATADLMSIMLRDSAHIMEKEAAWRARRHDAGDAAIAHPLYTVFEAERALARVHSMPYGERFQPRRTASFQFDDAGHILGAAIVSLWLEDNGHSRKVVFSGDLGQPARPVVRDPTPILNAGVLLIESTYGDRRHRDRTNTIDELVEVVHDSKKLNAISTGAVIIAGSGMCDGGRIKHHLIYNVEREESAVLFTGFQAKGTLGRRIVDGAQTVRIYGRELAVRASVHTLGGLSAHADRDALLAWLGHFEQAPKHVFVVHGEAQTAEAFAATIRGTLHWPALAPAERQAIEC